MVAVDSDRDITAHFSLCQPPVRIQGSSALYVNLQDAYDAAGEGDVIQCQAQEFHGNLILDLDKSVTFIGGYDCAYSDVIDRTRISGDVQLLDGEVTMENFIVQ